MRKTTPFEKERSHVPWSQRNGRLASFEEPTPEEDEGGREYEAPRDEGAEESEVEAPGLAARKVRVKEKGEGEGRRGGRRPPPRRAGTGISSFGVKRAKEGPPIGIHVDRGDEPVASTQRKGKGKAPAPKTKGGKCRKCDAEVEDEESGEEEPEGIQEEAAPPRKPVQIRLDLNLELEILLRAKIKGDITITFL